jgi:diguanylate cyclase
MKLNLANEQKIRGDDMLSNLFVNTTILISFIFLAGQSLKNTPKALNTLTGKAAVGIFGGFLGITLMFYSIRVQGQTQLDFRFIPVVLLAFYSSPLSTFIAAVIISIFRLAFYTIKISSILGVIATLIIAAGSLLLMRLKIKANIKFYIMFFYSLLVVIIVLVILLVNDKNYGIIIMTYSIIYTIAGLIAYKLTEYVISANKLYVQYKEQASRDFLTGLNNVRQFDLALNEANRRVNEYGERLSILVIDIDHFKKVNDTYGHDAGDAVLFQLGQMLSNSCRSFDIVARVGGEEFSVLLLDCPSFQALEIAERIRQCICNSKFILPSKEEIKISVSVGVATYPDSVDNLEELKKQADIELYKAKETGRNKVCSVFSKDCNN